MSSVLNEKTRSVMFEEEKKEEGPRITGAMGHRVVSQGSSHIPTDILGHQITEALRRESNLAIQLREEKRAHKLTQREKLAIETRASDAEASLSIVTKKLEDSEKTILALQEKLRAETALREELQNLLLTQEDTALVLKFHEKDAHSDSRNLQTQLSETESRIRELSQALENEKKQKIALVEYRGLTEKISKLEERIGRLDEDKFYRAVHSMFALLAGPHIGIPFTLLVIALHPHNKKEALTQELNQLKADREQLFFSSEPRL